MFRILFYKLVLLTLAMAAFRQRNYKIVFERADVERHNPACNGNVTVKTFKYNRTDTAFNASYYAPIAYGYDVYIIVQAFKFASNEYREFPLRYGFNPCDSLKKNDFGIKSSFKCGNFTGCPLNAGLYTVCNFVPDYSKFPPYIPAGSYMIEIQVYHKSVEMVMIRGYGTIKYPIV